MNVSLLFYVLERPVPDEFRIGDLTASKQSKIS